MKLPTLNTWIWTLLAFGYACASLGAQDRKFPPSFANVPYGDHEHQVLDVWLPESDTPTPFVVFIHGGGFAYGDKGSLRTSYIKQLLEAKIAVVAINYRLYHEAPLPAALHDSRRALQYVRSRAMEWNLDKSRVGAFGGSAGAVASMYLAFHDEMANPESSDIVERESSRLTCVAATSGQTTLDTAWWVANVPGWPGSVRGNKYAFERWGASEEDFPAVIKEGSALSLISADDPPIWMSYQMSPEDPMPAEKDGAGNWRVHHVNFGVALKEQMDRLGVEAHLRYPGSSEGPYEDLIGYLIAKLTDPDESSP